MCSGAGHGTGAQPGAPKGDSPLDQAGEGPPRQREQTPSLPGDPLPSAESDTPRGGGPDPDKDDGNDTAGPPPELEKQRVQVDLAAGRWGELPVQVREVFRVVGSDDLPAQYRDWIDGYYRRLRRENRR